MVVYPERMRENLNRSRGVVFSGQRPAGAGAEGRVARAGLRVGAAQRDAIVRTSSADFKALLLADPDVTRVLSPAEIERAFDLDEQLKHVDHVFDRVFHAVRA